MSHYTVGVIISNEEVERIKKECDLETNSAIENLVDHALEPFNENAESEPYLVLTTEELQDKYKEIINYEGEEGFYLQMKKDYEGKSFEEFCNSFYFGYTFEEDGAYSTYNQDSKWDWYVIGGRWNGCLPIKNQSINEDELLDQYSNDIKHNYCKIKDLELRREVSAKELEEMEKEYEEITTKGNWLKPEYYKQKYPTFEAYKDNELEFATYALLTSDGKWVEPGEMGWFGISSATTEEEVNFKNIFRENLDQEDPENYFILVDCHI